MKIRLSGNLAKARDDAKAHVDALFNRRAAARAHDDALWLHRRLAGTVDDDASPVLAREAERQAEYARIDAAQSVDDVLAIIKDYEAR